MPYQLKTTEITRNFIGLEGDCSTIQTRKYDGECPQNIAGPQVKTRHKNEG